MMALWDSCCSCHSLILPLLPILLFHGLIPFLIFSPFEIESRLYSLQQRLRLGLVPILFS